MTERKAITERMKIDCLLLRCFVTCSICNERLMPGDQIQWDHVHAIVFKGPHLPGNLRPVHYDPCHKWKSAQDVKDNAKVKRIAKGGRKRKGPPMKSRSFDKTLSRKFSGTTEARR